VILVENGFSEIELANGQMQPQTAGDDTIVSMIGAISKAA